VDPYPLADPDANPDPDFYFDAVADPDPDQTFHPDAESDPDPDPSFQIKAQTLEKVFKIRSYSIYIGLSSAK
jgi:hypothetical protein